ncbi:hypothetical protein [Bradyrhizobium liaoningense]|uniref:hypothetical protein n=1 Tax=Bradyrhizobium liaoningense TaxID=43992 RepID=UPI001BAB1AEF|nr:hypothetical protein [Bradyrhizobium liaoningense]MBR0823572.1 hypothetical protein [Bradyrhizobium liaoningense]
MRSLKLMITTALNLITSAPADHSVLMSAQGVDKGSDVFRTDRAPFDDSIDDLTCWLEKTRGC